MARRPFGSYLTTEGTEEELMVKHKKHKMRPVPSISALWLLRIFVVEFLPSSVSSVVNLKLKN